MLKRYVVPGRWGIALGVGLLAGACGRSGLLSDDNVWVDDPARLDGSLPDTLPPLPDSTSPYTCVPTEEVCNGIDDDCDGLIDEVPSIPCEGGGEQYCVAGHMSECPTRCEACMPGAERICFNSYCKYWAVQTCAADGKGFGKCKEHDVPPECAAIAKDLKYSKELEQCCIDNDYCCADDFDLDHDGNTGDMVGRCEEVVCQP